MKPGQDGAWGEYFVASVFVVAMYKEDISGEARYTAKQYEIRNRLDIPHNRLRWNDDVLPADLDLRERTDHGIAT